LGAYALMPGVKVIAPWREWDLLSRDKLLAYADQHGIPVDYKKRKGQAPFSMDANLLHISYEGGVLEDPSQAPPEKGMWRLTVPVEKAPNKPEEIELTFAKGDLVAINGKKMKAHALLTELNRLGGKHGIGRLDLVENRYVGMKSRGCYETPGGTILLRAHRAIESLTLDREVAHLKDDLMPRYASMIYNGYWWSPERQALQVLIDHTQQVVNGTVRLKLFKGNVIVVGSLMPRSPPSMTTVAPTTRPMQPASSSSTPCVCASPPPSDVKQPEDPPDQEPDPCPLLTPP
jgi:argininosuccinate synthase